MIKFPLASPPPAPRHRSGIIIGLIAAGILVLFALIHLFRIDTFLPEMNYALPVGQRWASLITLLIIVSEVFAIPFLLRMKLSPLARFLSGLFVIIAPLSWLLISIWNYGFTVSTAQLGEFYSLPSTWFLIALNVLWLSLNFFALWALGYDKPKRLSK